MKFKLCSLVLAACAATAYAGGRTVDPWAPSGGPLRVEGTPETAGVLKRWIAGFAKQRPEIEVESHLRGTDVGLGALVTGRADIALAGREAAAQEVKGFEWIYRYRPTSIEVMNGSLNHPGCSPALGVLVHRANPLGSISIAQLQRMFDAGRPESPPWRRWQEAGLGEAWAERPIHLYMPDAESGTGAAFRASVLAGARAFPWEHVTEIVDGAGQGMERHDAGRRLARAVSRDPLALAVAPLSPGLPVEVKVLPLADSGPAVLPSVDSVTARSYPLGRVVRAYVNAAPARPIDPARAHPIDPRVTLFLRYVLSPEGQRDVAADAAYLPLDGRQAVAQLDLLR